MINLMDLSGKLYLVTGASMGLGRQVCITLSQMGARVVMVARNEDNLQKTQMMLDGNGHKYYSFDLEKIENLENLIKKIVTENGKLDGFVHCAGIGESRPLSLTTCEFTEKVMAVNVLSFIEIVRLITKKKNYDECASIVGISSTASIRGDKAKAAYCMSKGALDSAVKALAIELGESKKIRVNTVNPGWIKTEMYNRYIGIVDEKKEQEIRERQFLGVAKPVEIANVVVFLLSSAASQITGQSIIVDGGSSIN